MDPEDIFQDVIKKLYESSFLKRYDPSKARLNTYFTIQVKKCILSLYTKTKKEKEWRPRFTPDVTNKKEKFYWEQVYCPHLNGISKDFFINSSEWENEIEFSLESHIDEKVSFDNLFQKAQNKLSNNNKIVLKMLKEGLTQSEIARHMKVTPTAIHLRLLKIRDTFSKVTNY
jgi:RNA polymerase sigma factor (sigma-70 family)